MTPHYQPPFTEEHHYRFPLHWLHAVRETGALDARDLLLAHTYDQHVIFADGRGEQPWFEDDEQARLRGLCTRQTFARHKQTLVTQGWLAKYARPPRPSTLSAAAHRDLQQNIKYQISEWPSTATWLYRPRDYLERRWPAWLGNTDLGSRLILLALLAAYAQDAAAQITPPAQVTVRWQALVTFVRRYVGHGWVDDDEKLLLTKLRKGIQELVLLGVIVEETTAPLCYTLHTATLAATPTWPDEPLAQMCGLAVTDAASLRLLRDLLTHCCEPVTRVTTVWRTLQRQRLSPYLLDESDWGELHKFIHRQRKAGPLLRHDQLLDNYLRRSTQQQRRLCSAEFTLPVQETALTRQTATGEPIQLPVTTTRGVEATQLWLACERAAGLSVVETQDVLARTRLLVWQERAGHAPVAVPLVCPRPKPLGVEYGFVLRANDLHGRIDYAYPLEVWLKCDQPEPRLTLRGRWRVLLGKESQVQSPESRVVRALADNQVRRSAA